MDSSGNPKSFATQSKSQLNVPSRADRLQRAKETVLQVEQSDSVSQPSSRRARLIVDPVTGDKVARVEGYSDDASESQRLSLWDILCGGITIKNKDGKPNIRIQPLTLGTLAKLEQFELGYDVAKDGYLAKVIKMLTIMLNDSNQGRPQDRGPVTEEEVSNMISSDMYETVLQAIQEMVRPLKVAAVSH